MNVQSESILTPDGMTMLKNFLSIQHKFIQSEKEQMP